MEIYDLKQDIKTFGFQVKTFPMGIGESFDALMKIIPDGKNRAYYGISYLTADFSVIYYAMAEEIFKGEAEKYGDYARVIERGKYLTVRIKGWRTKTDSIKDVFGEIMKDERADLTKPCVEWYMSDDEMLCMLQLKTPV